MSDYSGMSGYSGGGDRGRVMEQVRSQIAVASAQELIQVSTFPKRGLVSSIVLVSTCMHLL